MDPFHYDRSGDLYDLVGQYATPAPVPVFEPVAASKPALQYWLSWPPSCDSDLLFLQALLDDLLTNKVFENPNITSSGIFQEGWRIKVGLDESRNPDVAEFPTYQALVVPPPVSTPIPTPVPMPVPMRVPTPVKAAPARPTQKKPYKGLKGARLRKWGKWVSEVRAPYNQHRIWLGSWGTAIEAACAYDLAARMMRGRKAILNFPECQRAVELPKKTAQDLMEAGREGARKYRIPEVDQMFLVLQGCENAVGVAMYKCVSPDRGGICHS